MDKLKRVRHPDAHVIDTWADELAAKLGKSRQHILELSYVDAGGKQVILQYADGSQALYRNSISVLSDERKQTAIFTEHCGYLVYKLLANMEVIEKDFVNGEWRIVSHHIQEFYRDKKAAVDKADPRFKDES